MNFDTSASHGKYMRVNDVATELGVSHQHVRNLIFRNELRPVNRVGSLLLIPRASVDEFLTRSVVQPTQAVAA